MVRLKAEVLRHHTMREVRPFLIAIRPIVLLPGYVVSRR